MSALQLLLLNAFAYTALLVLYIKKIAGYNAGAFILTFYAICAWGAVAYHEHPWYSMMRGAETFTGEAFVYLFAGVFVYLYPILKFNSLAFKYVQCIDEKCAYSFARIVLLVQIILYITVFPAVFKSLITSDIGDFRQEMYDDAERIKYPIYILNLMDRLYMGARNVILIISAYFLLVISERRLFYKIFFITSFVYPIYHFIAYASRAVMVTQFIFSVFIVLCLIVFIEKHVFKKITFYLTFLLLPAYTAFTAITVSRFGDAATYMNYRYLGESFNNYNANLYGHITSNTWGTAYLSFFRKIVGTDTFFKTTKEKWDYIEGITNVDPHVFYTFIGALNIEFGYTIPFVIGLFMSVFMYRKLRPFDILTLPKLILICMLAYTLINGAFCFILQGDWGNLEIVFTVLLYFYAKRLLIDEYISAK